MSFFSSILNYIGLSPNTNPDETNPETIPETNPEETNLEEVRGGEYSHKDIERELQKFEDPKDREGNVILERIKKTITKTNIGDSNQRGELIKNLELFVKTLDEAIDGFEEGESKNKSKSKEQRGGSIKRRPVEYEVDRMVRRKVVGIITVPTTLTDNFYDNVGDSFIFESHLNWIQGVGLKVLPIPYNLPEDKIGEYFNNINGLYIPSSTISKRIDSKFTDIADKLIQMAIEANDRGEYFPVWGVCNGFQHLIRIADLHKNPNLLDTFDSHNLLKLPLHLTKEATRSNLFNHLFKNNPDLVKDLMTKDITINNHVLGISPSKFYESEASNFYKVISYNYDRKNKPFISTIEGKKYPFYGVQWHPEKKKELNYFIKFFANEVVKNKRMVEIPKSLLMTSMTMKCFKHDPNTNCKFYWHNF